VAPQARRSAVADRHDIVGAERARLLDQLEGQRQVHARLRRYADHMHVVVEGIPRIGRFACGARSVSENSVSSVQAFDGKQVDVVLHARNR
jgi:hypothetical protein